MCNSWCVAFVERCLPWIDAQSRVLEVGARDVNGTVRPVLAGRCSEYVGADIEAGPGVDVVANAEALDQAFAHASFDVVVSTETIEHVENWPRVLEQMLAVLKPGGHLLLTTRSPGFERHGFPHDHWRYRLADLETILSAVGQTVHSEIDYSYDYACGVGICVRKAESAIDLFDVRQQWEATQALFHIDWGQAVTYQESQCVLASARLGSVEEQIACLGQQFSAFASCPVQRVDRLGAIEDLERTQALLNLDQHSAQVLAVTEWRPEPLAGFLQQCGQIGVHIEALGSVEDGLQLVLSHEAAEDLRRACALMRAVHSDLMGVVNQAPAGWFLIPHQRKQSRDIQRQLDVWLLNALPRPVWGEIEAVVLPSEGVSLRVVEAAFGAGFVSPTSYQHRHCWSNIYLAPGAHRIQLQVQEPLSINGFQFRCKQSADWDEQLLQLSADLHQAQRQNQVHEVELQRLRQERDHYRQAVEARDQQIESLETHAQNIDILRNEREKESRHYKVLYEEEKKHAQNLQAELDYYKNQVTGSDASSKPGSSAGKPTGMQ